jgi:2-succinyl-6-hydroxy-2,4-cyclohexadiene-1-carboxylate synthase
VRVVLVHGFTQTGRSWAPVAESLHRRRPDLEIVTPDLPGHGGRGGHDGEPIDLWDTAAVVGTDGGSATYVGYSLGGRVVLHLALARPDLVTSMVLVGATPGIEDDGERAQRRAADDALADHLELIGVEAFLDEWLSQPIFATLPLERADRAGRSGHTAAGLATSLRTCGTGTQTPLWDRLAEITAPTLVVAGTLDDKFTTIGRRMAAAIPDATFAGIGGAGHSVPLEQPDSLADAIAAWLAQPPTASPTANATP